MNINIDELREAVELMRELERIAEKVNPMFQAIEKNGGVVVPVATDRFITRGEVCKILKIGSATLSTLIREGDLTPLYIAGSSQAKFRLSEVENIPLKNKPKKIRQDTFGDKRGKPNKVN